jgi:cytochrome P450
MTARTLPPGPKARPVRGLLPEWRRDPLTFLTDAARDYGDVVRLRIGPINFYLLNHPDLIEAVLVTHNKVMTKGRGLEATEEVLGNGLLTSEGDFWRRQRRLAQPGFHKDRITAYADTMVRFTEEHIAPWQAGETRDIHREMMRLTSAIAAKTLFSADVRGDTDAVGTALDITIDMFQRRVRSLIKIPHSWPTPANRRFMRAVNQLDEVIYKIIEQRRAGGEDPGDLLSMLMNAVDEDGSRMTPKQLRDEVMTLFLAGHETTANTLSWTWYLLGQNPAVADRLHEEVAAVLGGRAPTPSDLPRLPYVEAVVNEALRVYPPAWVMGRHASAPLQLGEYEFPAEVDYMFSQWVMHRHPAYFADPLSFKPERWLDGLAKRLPAFAYFPFGGGPRMCIGKGFALMEAQLLLATIVQRYRFALVPGQVVVANPAITLRPRDGVMVTVGLW